MSTFDPNAYRKRVLAPLTERTGQDLPDPFKLVDLDPATDDEVLIQERIRDVVAFWQRERNSPKYKGLVTILLAQRAEMTAVLTDARRRSDLRAKVLAARSSADAARFTRLDAMVAQLVGRNQGIPRSKLESLRAAANRSGLTDEEFRARIASKPVIDDVVAGAAPLAAPLRRQIRSLLEEHGRLTGQRAHKTLFEFLGAAPDGVAALREARDKLAARNRQRRHDRERTVVDELLALSTTHLIGGDRSAYVAGLAEDVKDHLRGDVETAVLVDDRLTAAEFERLVREAVAEGLSPQVARTMLISLAQECGGGVDVGTPVDYVVCPACSTAEAAGGPRKCRRCGTDLYATCPSCGAEVEAVAAGCTKCGADLRAHREATVEAQLAQAALDAGAVVEARWRAERALALDHALPVRELHATIEARYKTVAQQWRSAEQAIDAGRFYDASHLLDQIARTGSDVPGAEGADLEAVVQRVAAGMEAARREVAQVATTQGAERERAVLDLLDRLPDSPEALALLREIPVSAPRRVSAMVTSTGVKVMWKPSPAPGRVEYRVVRREGPADGVERSLGTTDRVEMEDAGVSPGALVSYAVTARRLGISSGVTRTSMLLVAKEVDALSATEGDGEVVLKWRLAAPVASVHIERRTEPNGTEPDRRQRVEGATYRDEQVVNGREYVYRVVVEYPDGEGGVFRTSGREVRARPTAPPVPVERLGLETSDGEVRIRWDEPPVGSVVIYRTDSVPAQPAGTILDARSLDRLGRKVRPAGAGLAVDGRPAGVHYYVPVTVAGSLASLGTAVLHVGLADVAGLSAENDGDDVVLRWQWPAGCTEALVIWRRDRAPLGPDDATEKAKTTNMKYDIAGGWRFTPEGAEPYHFAVVAGARKGNVLHWAASPGTDARLVVHHVVR